MNTNNENPNTFNIMDKTPRQRRILKRKLDELEMLREMRRYKRMMQSPVGRLFDDYSTTEDESEEETNNNSMPH